MNERDIEFLISQSLDNQLTAEDRAYLESEMARDPEVRALYDQHEKLNALLKSDAELSGIRWDRLASSISNAIDRQEEEAPAVLFSFKQFRTAAIAIAACLIVALGVWMGTAHRSPSQPGMAQVAVLEQPGAAQGPASISVEIGPGDASASADNLAVQEAITSRSTRVAIDSGVMPAQDSDRLPY